ncbi:MAG: hypothetical protein J2P19_19175 [Pseudonocardia sp.]|nr:hypothetical protein [Pseudonocardia sp.]
MTSPASSHALARGRRLLNKVPGVTILTQPPSQGGLGLGAEAQGEPRATSPKPNSEKAALSALLTALV